MNAVPIVLGFSMVVLILLGLTLIFVGGYYVVRLAAAYCRGRSYEAARTKDESRSQASELAWLALKVGPAIGLGVSLFFIVVMTFAALIAKLLSILFDVQPPGDVPRDLRDFLHFALAAILVTGISTLCGAIAAVAFWTSSAFMRQARKKLKRSRGAGVWDLDLDGTP